MKDNHEKKYTLGYVPGGKSNTIPLIISVLEFSTEIIDYDNLYQLLKRKTDTKKSSINGFLTFMTNLGLLDRVGEKVYKTTETGMKFYETDTPEIALLFLLQKNYRYILEILFELNNEPKTSNELAVAGLTKYGMSSDNKDRINERLSLLRIAQLIINDKGKSIKLSKRGENLLKVLVEKVDFQLNNEISEQTKVEEKGTENYLGIIEETRLASVNSAKPHHFEEMLEKMFEMLGFKTKLEAKPGTTDIVLTAPTVPTFAYKVAIEAKTNRDGKITDKMINFDALLEHKEKHKTDYIAIVGKTFYGERVFRYAENHHILLIDINDLEELVKKHQKYPLQALEYKKLFNQKGKVNISVLDDIYMSMKRRKVLFQLILQALIQNSDDDFTEGFLTEREIYICIKEDELFKEAPVTKQEVRDMLSLLSNPLIGCIGTEGKGYYAKGSLEDAQLKFGFYYSATLI